MGLRVHLFWPRLGDVCPCTGAWSTLFPRKGMLSLSRGATGFHLPGETPVYPPRVLLALPRGSEAWNLITGQLTCNEHLPCLGFFYFQKSPLLSTMGKRTFGSFFHTWQSSHWTFSFGAGHTAEGGSHRREEWTALVFYPSSAAY